MFVSIIISNPCQQTHPESWEPGLEPITLSSLRLTVAGDDPLNLTFLPSCVPSFKRVKYCLCSFTLPSRVQKVVAKVCLPKYQVLFSMPFALMAHRELKGEWQQLLLEPCFKK